MTPGAADQWAVKIQNVREETATGAQGQRTTQIVITFNVGSHGPFTERFDKATFDSTQANAALANFASKLSNLQGR